ncbi:hypothetical protein M899_1871 [Bacteriovorax sp. BSW11_IV]|uniref:hypothetical protein n=1 Tax=Bacteriovorax sp. BSW11_IV TaxID=1353529 RepID=UPI00038A3DB2|nr:hypothetical protein [Bacteriovorax sp. BSW11_IV]EQC48430.1 hypothetical protein M899_1871 [Bacteriovorax sp. BSW11_IV]
MSIIERALSFISYNEKVFSKHPFLDEKKKVIHCNCASFISFALNSTTFFRANEFYNALAQKKLGNPISNFNELGPGDILCWKKDIVPKNGDSGHMAIIYKIENDPNSALQKVWVLDSSKLPHDQDKRTEGPGLGLMRIEIDDDKKMIGLQWSSERKKIKRTALLAIRLTSIELKDFS